jgi:hypothetical protein
MGIFDLFKKKNMQGEKLNLRDTWVDIDPVIVNMRAKVVDMCCFTETVGTQPPRLVQNFFVFFEDDGGEIHKIAVSEDMYVAFEVGQVGELTLIDGNVSSYVLDEDI